MKTNLDNDIGLHPDHSNWREYLKQQELLSDGGGIRHYRRLNENYIVDTNGDVTITFGIHHTTE